MKSLLISVQDAACLMLDSVSAFYWQDRCQGDDQANQESFSCRFAIAIAFASFTYTGCLNITQLTRTIMFNFVSPLWLFAIR